MRKQTKLVAVLSAAALLAIGASMTSFAAGWQKNDDGSWGYFDNDDEMVTGEWKKDGSKFFYLDDDGLMLTDSWVDDEYYVGNDGAMVVNDWKKTLADEDQDDPDEDGESWYYFNAKGKKVMNDDKKIGGKTYFFNDEGKMQTGWYSKDDSVYFLGEEDDGARKTGWLWLAAPDAEDDDEKDAADTLTHTGDEDDACDEEGWYFFETSGKLWTSAKQKKVNGKYYYFNNHGQMLYEWINGVKSTMGSNAQLDSDDTTASPADVRYMNAAEEGWRADGWYQIDGADVLGAGDDTDWYYFKDGKSKKAESGDETDFVDGSATVVSAKIKVLGKNFCFNELGQMQTGLQPIGKGSNLKIYYFDENGYMKTGKIASAEEENDSFTYYFETKSGKNGQGVTGEKSGYLYWNGKRLEADDDYRVYRIDGAYYLVNNKGKLQKSDSKKYEIENMDGSEYEFKFNKTSYQITSVDKKDGEPTSDAKTDLKATEPKIELYDSVFRMKDGEQGVVTKEAFELEQERNNSQN